MPEIAMDTAYEAILLSQRYNYSENYDFRNSWISPKQASEVAICPLDHIPLPLFKHRF
jgi:hypothetical protein